MIVFFADCILSKIVFQSQLYSNQHFIITQIVFFADCISPKIVFYPEFIPRLPRQTARTLYPGKKGASLAQNIGNQNHSAVLYGVCDTAPLNW